MFGLLGTLLGFGGSFFTKIISLFEDGLKSKEEDKKRAHEIKLLELQFNQQITLKQKEIEGESHVAEVSAQAAIKEASYKHDTDYGEPSQWAINILRLFRPCLTLLLVGIVFVIYFNSQANMREAITLSLIELSATALTWWFGDRDRKSVV